MGGDGVQILKEISSFWGTYSFAGWLSVSEHFFTAPQPVWGPALPLQTLYSLPKPPSLRMSLRDTTKFQTDVGSFQNHMALTYILCRHVLLNAIHGHDDVNANCRRSRKRMWRQTYEGLGLLTGAPAIHRLLCPQAVLAKMVAYGKTTHEQNRGAHFTYPRP